MFSLITLRSWQDPAIPYIFQQCATAANDSRPIPGRQVQAAAAISGESCEFVSNRYFAIQVAKYHGLPGYVERFNALYSYDRYIDYFKMLYLRWCQSCFVFASLL